MATEIRAYEIPLIESLKPAITYSIQDIKNPSKRKGEVSKTITLPSSKELDKLFNFIFEINTVTNSFNPNKKLDVEYYADDQLQLSGFLKLNEIITVDKSNIKYSVHIFGETPNLFLDIGEKELTDIQGLDEFNHDLFLSNISDSWATQIWKGGVQVPFLRGQGYVYPLIENGFDTDIRNFTTDAIFPAFYAKEYFNRIIADAGYTITSSFLGGNPFNGLIIPFNQTRISLTSDQIQERIFGAEDATQTVALTNENVVFPTESDPNNIYDNSTGIFTAPDEGYYNFTAVLDVEAEFIPSGNSVDVMLNLFAEVIVEVRINGVVKGSANIILGDNDVAIASGGTYLTGTNVAYPSDAHNTNIVTSSSNVPPTIVILNKVDNKRTNPASNVRVICQNNPLFSGDQVAVTTRLVTTNYKVFPSVSQPFYDATGATYGGSINAYVRSGKFLNTVTNSALLEGSEIDMYSVVPKGIKQKDFVTSLLKMFNLQIEPSKTNPKELIIEPYNDFYVAGGPDWSEKRDLSKDLIQSPMGLLEASEYLYQYKGDKDKFNKSYEAEYGETYGQRSGLIDNEFLKNITKTELIFSPTPIVGQSDIDMVLPTIIKDDDTYKATDSNIRILYYGGLKPTSTPFQITDRFGNTVIYNSYPYSGHFDDPFNPTFDINFGLPKRLYYDNTFNDINITNNNLFNKYHLPALQQIANRDSKLVEGWFYLTPADIQNLSFRLTYFFDNTYFRLYKVENYDPNRPLTKCSFIKLISVNPFTSISVGADGGFATVADGFDGGVQTNEDVPYLDYDRVDNRNNYDDKSGSVEGYDNTVSESSLFVTIKGDRNFVGANTRNITLINSNDNFIASGLKNVTLINSEGITVTKSDTTYFNGVELSGTDHHSGWYNIESDKAVTIVDNKQMAVFNRLTLDGTLNINGQLILK